MPFSAQTPRLGSWGGGGGGGGRGYSGGSGRGGGGRGGQQSNTDWKETVKTDRSAVERPKWQFTCYGHEREGPNDITGDISPEELRWANMLAVQRGTPMAQVITEYKLACKAKIEQFQALQRSNRAPSKGGPAIPPPSPGISNLGWVTGSSGFGAAGGPSGGFGATPFGQPAQPSQSPFGQPASTPPAPIFGQQPAQSSSGGGLFGAPPPAAPAAPTAAPFGQAAGFGGTFGAAGASGGFGGGFGGGGGGAAKPAFGQQPAGQLTGSTPFGGGGGFGSATATAASPFGGGAAAPSAGGFGTVFGSAAAAASPAAPLFGQPSAFGQPPAAAPASTFPPATGSSPFGQPPAPAATSPFGAFGTGGLAAQQQPQPQPQQAFLGQQAPAAGGMGDGAESNIDPEEAAAWQAGAFEKGKIPEHAPPQVYCR